MYEFIPFVVGYMRVWGTNSNDDEGIAAHLLRWFDWTLLGEATFVQFPLKKIRDSIKLVRRVPEV